MKVLICGSRDWSNDKMIEAEFKKLPPGSIIVHGAGKTGAEAVADKMAMKFGFQIRRYPVDESSEGSVLTKRNAKMIRNEHVSGDPIHLGIAFTQDYNRSRDVKDLVERARKAGIKVVVMGS